MFPDISVGSFLNLASRVFGKRVGVKYQREVIKGLLRLFDEKKGYGGQEKERFTNIDNHEHWNFYFFTGSDFNLLVSAPIGICSYRPSGKNGVLSTVKNGPAYPLIPKT